MPEIETKSYPISSDIEAVVNGLRAARRLYHTFNETVPVARIVAGLIARLRGGK
jgi:hypothetical protein